MAETKKKAPPKGKKTAHSSLEITGHLGSALLAATAWVQMTDDEGEQKKRSEIALRIGMRFQKSAERLIEDTTKKKS